MNLACAAMAPNTRFEVTGRFLRFGGHPELTIQECSDAEGRTENDEQIHG
jgi:hypothetical protein